MEACYNGKSILLWCPPWAKVEQVARQCLKIFELGESKTVTLKQRRESLPEKNNICSKSGVRLILDVVASG